MRVNDGVIEANGLPVSAVNVMIESLAIFPESDIIEQGASLEVDDGFSLSSELFLSGEASLGIVVVDEGVPGSTGKADVVTAIGRNCSGMFGGPATTEDRSLGETDEGEEVKEEMRGV